LNESSNNHTEQSRARIEHLDHLHDIPNLADVKYEDWSRVRLDRLLVDYLLRMGFTNSARGLAREKGIEKLVDVDEFEAVGRIERSLREEHQVNTALSWCSENKQGLKKINSNFEFELRLQQVVELARSGEMTKLLDAVLHTRKYLSGHPDNDLAMKAAGLLAYPPDTESEPYKVCPFPIPSVLPSKAHFAS
jgi:macrophage erythroblast attacher